MRWLGYLLAAAYVLWPLDLIPDVLGPLGWLDDALMGAIALYFTLRRWRERLHGPRKAKSDVIDVPPDPPRP